MFRKPTEYFWTMTIQWYPAPGTTHTATSWRVVTPSPTATLGEVFEEAFGHVCERNNAPDNCLLLHWDIKPNRLPRA